MLLNLKFESLKYSLAKNKLIYYFMTIDLIKVFDNKTFK